MLDWCAYVHSIIVREVIAPSPVGSVVHAVAVTTPSTPIPRHSPRPAGTASAYRRPASAGMQVNVRHQRCHAFGNCSDTAGLRRAHRWRAQGPTNTHACAAPADPTYPAIRPVNSETYRLHIRFEIASLLVSK